MEDKNKGTETTEDVKDGPTPEERPEPEVPNPATPPHPVSDEDPEAHIGEEMDDPWVDPSQTDWPNNEEPADDETTEEVPANG
jgi:hypothetical protein